MADEFSRGVSERDRLLKETVAQLVDGEDPRWVALAPTE